MEQERKFIIDEKQLLRFLEDTMVLDMLESNGVDNWEGYGVNRIETIQRWYPMPLTEEEITEKNIGFYKTSQAVVENGEFILFNREDF